MSEIYKFYPEPRYKKIIEPFGFPAIYSLMYHEKQVLINDFSLDEYQFTNEKMSKWEFSFKPYYNLKNEEATWFIKAPSKNPKIDYNYLGNWCKKRMGQVIVIEHISAEWLNFKEIVDGEAMWTNFAVKKIRTQLPLWT